MEKKDVSQREDQNIDLFQQLMTDRSFDPFGTFYTLGRHFNPITQDVLQINQFIQSINQSMNYNNYLIFQELQNDRINSNKYDKNYELLNMKRENTFIEDVSKEQQQFNEEYYENITSKTKDDDVIFNPTLKFTPVIEDTVFNSENIVEFDEQYQYKKLKLQKSQEISFKDTEKRKYLYLFKVRCLLYQPTDLQQCEQKHKFKMYEYASFDLFRMKDAKKLDEINLTLDFVTMTAQMTKEGQNIDPKFNFKEIEGANCGYVSDEVYLTLRQRESNPTILKFKMKYCFQRDLAVEVFNLVNHFCRKYPKKAQTTYTNDDANLHKQEHENKLEILKIRRTKLSIIKSDNIIPPKSILSYRASFKYKDKKVEASFTLGINNIVVHSAAFMEDKLQPEPKAKSREKKLYDFIYHVIPFNHCYFYCDQGSIPFNKLLKMKLNSQELEFEFETPTAVQNVITAIKGIQSGDIMSDQIYIHIQTKQNEKQNQIKEHFFRAKQKEISKLIAYHKEMVNQLQSAKTVLDFEFYKDFEVYNSDDDKQEKGRNKSEDFNQFENDDQSYDENINQDDNNMF